MFVFFFGTERLHGSARGRAVWSRGYGRAAIGAWGRC